MSGIDGNADGVGPFSVDVSCEMSGIDGNAEGVGSRFSVVASVVSEGPGMIVGSRVVIVGLEVGSGVVVTLRNSLPVVIVGLDVGSGVELTVRRSLPPVVACDVVVSVNAVVAVEVVVKVLVIDTDVVVEVLVIVEVVDSVLLSVVVSPPAAEVGPKVSQTSSAALIATSSLENPASVYVAPPIERRIVLLYSC